MDCQLFLRFSSEVTGYSQVELEGTGLANEYFHLVEKQLGPDLNAQFYAVVRSVLGQSNPDEVASALNQQVIESDVWWPLAQTLVSLWYLGYWKSLAASWYASAKSAVPEGVAPGNVFVPSPAAYTQQLAYRAAGAHPPGANPTGYGSWSIPPVFGDVLHPPETTL